MTWEMLAVLLAALCPMSLFIGAVGMFLAMTVWRMQQKQQANSTPAQTRTIARDLCTKIIQCQPKHIVDVMHREESRPGYQWYCIRKWENGPGIWCLEFVDLNQVSQ